uniref:Uncharacterized protein n=1 Tax=Oryza barthii TaxID=65489 RepID=A0A0D3EK25_9ORYZ
MPMTHESMSRNGLGGGIGEWVSEWWLRWAVDLGQQAREQLLLEMGGGPRATCDEMRRGRWEHAPAAAPRPHSVSWAVAAAAASTARWAVATVEREQ